MDAWREWEDDGGCGRRDEVTSLDVLEGEGYVLLDADIERQKESS